VFVIAVVKDEDTLLNAERQRLSEWAPANGWTYVEYVDAVDLLARITDFSAELIRERSRLLLMAIRHSVTTLPSKASVVWRVTAQGDGLLARKRRVLVWMQHGASLCRRLHRTGVG